MNKAIFLDRDGTINVEKNYLYKIDDFVFLPGVIQALTKLQSAGFLLIIISNQSGIARGFYTENKFEELNKWMLSSLKKQGVNVSAVYYCPHHPDALIKKYRKECDCRKPKLGLFEKAIKEFDIDLSHSFAIGDKIRDCAICLRTPCRGFLVGSNESTDIINDVKNGKVPNVEYAESLLDCIRKIFV